MLKNINQSADYSDVILIGGGIMSATLGTILKYLQPDLKITIYERLDRVAAESSDAWNNAGTGHSALCELNYSPQNEDGTVDCSKALKINDAFQVSKQFWASLVDKKMISNPSSFINPIPHLSFVMGEENISYLKKRYEILKNHHSFADMQFSDNSTELKKWIPLVMNKRKGKSAATYTDAGTDVNFGNLTRILFENLIHQTDVKLRLSHEVQAIERTDDGTWELTMDNLATEKRNKKKAYGGFVFVGAGGGALKLLEKSDIEESKGYGGFPVSGQWLRCINPKIIKKHHAKVYGKAAIGAPPMSVPHLDSRIIDGQQELLFGPFAGFTTRFLKDGSLMDLPKSLNLSNIIPMIQVGLHNFDLTKYLIEQVVQSPEDRLEALQEYYPDAKLEDWELLVAGQRVQVIKKDPELGGILEFGTEIVASEDGSIAALLGASPGASTAVDIMMKLIQKCFPEEFKSSKWQKRIKELIPAFGIKLSDNPEMFKKMDLWTSEKLGINPVSI